jgi:hypothetical protein
LNTGTADAADFVENANSGYLTLSNGQATLTLTLKNDVLTEGPETINIQVYENALVATTSEITVPDTSTIPIYTISPANSTTASGEGISLTFTINTNAPNGRRFYWANVGTTVAGDFVENVNNGYLEPTDGSATLTLNVRNDTLTEGTETVRIALYHDEARTNVATLSGVVSVPDTSLTPLNPTAIPNLRMWMDATDPNNTGITPSNNTVLSTWVDKSGANNSFVENAPSRNPTYSNSGLIFTAAEDDGFNYPSNIPSTNCDMLFVSMPRTGTYSSFGLSANVHVMGVNGTALVSYDGAFKQFGSLTVASNTRHLIFLRSASNGLLSASINGTETLATNNVITTGNMSVFANSVGYKQVWGTINEYLYYTSNLSLSDRQKMEGYLAWKWDISTSLPSNHPFKSVRPT